ncbi:MAG: hypothetical protein QM504_08960 [Pseudomonadota bacterium]
MRIKHLKKLTVFIGLLCILLFVQQTVLASTSTSATSSKTPNSTNTGISTMRSKAPNSTNNLLYVFYPTDIRPKKMERHISRYCPEINITVFAKIKDFEEQTRRIPPEAILSYAPVIKKNQQYTSLVQGFKQGRSYEDYVLVSIEEKVDISQLASIKIGVLDILGRNPMKLFISKTLRTNVKIARVTKTEDILNLLIFGLVDALFVSQQRYEKFHSQSLLPLVATKLDLKMDLAVLAVKSDKSKELFLNCFNRLGKQTNSLLGVDQWALINEQTNRISGRWLWALK